MWRALRHRNFRIFFYGQSVSLVGTWMQQIAIGWLVYRMTDSALLLGIVGFSGQIATFFLLPFAGVIADRHHRHRLLLVSQVAAMLQAIVLSVLFFSHAIVIWQIVALSLISGIINAFDLPIRQSFIVDMINDPDDLSNAIALNSTMVNGARLAGPAIGGILIAMSGEGSCFLLNALSYVAVIISLMVMQIPRKEHHRGRTSILKELKEGFQYTFGFMPIRTILTLLSAVSLIGGGAQVLMPVFARDVFHGGAQTLGLLMASSGLGALMGAIYLARRKTVLGLGKVILGSSILFGIGMMGFAIVPWLWPSMFFLLCSGFGLMVQMAASNTVLQSMVDDNKRGRVMSFYTMSFMGMAPFGSLLAGSLAAHGDPRPVLLFGGIFALGGGVLFSRQLPRLRALIRPLYIQKGILVPDLPQ
jgi:MFS family permease